MKKSGTGLLAITAAVAMAASDMGASVDMRPRRRIKLEREFGLARPLPEYRPDQPKKKRLRRSKRVQRIARAKLAGWQLKGKCKTRWAS